MKIIFHNIALFVDNVVKIASSNYRTGYCEIHNSTGVDTSFHSDVPVFATLDAPRVFKYPVVYAIL